MSEESNLLAWGKRIMMNVVRWSVQVVLVLTTLSASARDGESSSISDTAPSPQSSIMDHHSKGQGTDHQQALLEVCSSKSLHLPLDHGPRATSTTWLNAQRIAECNKKAL
jgi:hypothetical protein